MFEEEFANGAMTQMSDVDGAYLQKWKERDVLLSCPISHVRRRRDRLWRTDDFPFRGGFFFGEWIDALSRLVSKK